MKTNQVNLKRRSFAGVGRIPDIHKKTTSTGPTSRDKRQDRFIVADYKPFQIVPNLGIRVGEIHVTSPAPWLSLFYVPKERKGLGVMDDHYVVIYIGIA